MHDGQVPPQKDVAGTDVGATDALETNARVPGGVPTGGDEGQQKRFTHAAKVNRQQADAMQGFKRNLQRYTPLERFSWPEDRGETEKWISELRMQQILLIHGAASEWLNWAPQRFAMVLETSINRVWPECEGIFRLKTEGNVSFRFWRDLGRFDRPVALVVPMDDSAEYLRQFIYAGYEKAYGDLRQGLKNVNIFLILQISDDQEAMGRLLKGQQRGLYAVWTVPAVKLELRRQMGIDGDRLLERIRNEFGLTAEDDRQLYDVVREERVEGEEALMEIIRTEVQVNNAERQLIETALTDESELKLRLTFCAAFFNDLSYCDMVHMMGFLLKDKVEEQRSGTGTVVEKKPLKDKLAKPIFLKKLMSECELRVQDVNEFSRVNFTRRIRFERVKKIFLDEGLLFFMLTEELLRQDVLFDRRLSDRMRMGLARILVTLISRNHTTYDGNWLVEKAGEQLMQLYESLPEEKRQQIEEEADLSLDKWVLEPMSYLLRELLLTGREELIRMVKVFFERLIDSGLKKKDSLGLAMDLFRDLRGEGNFPQQDLDMYFKSALEKGAIDEKYEVYRMIFNGDFQKELYKKMSDWRSAEGKSAYPWSVRFACLHRLDYCIVSFYEHFQENKEKKEYELLKGVDDVAFSPELNPLLEDITSDEVLRSWRVLTEDNDQLFTNRCIELENGVTGLRWIIAGRHMHENKDVLTLAGDIIENWFYILFREQKASGEKKSPERMHAFIRLLHSGTDKQKLEKLTDYWLRKCHQLYPWMVEALARDEHYSDKEKTAFRRKLNDRSASLLSMIRKP